jgi:hypothetical protein
MRKATGAAGYRLSEEAGSCTLHPPWETFLFPIPVGKGSIESRDVVEKCAPSSGMVSYGLRWFCSLLSLERREKVVHRAGAEGAAGHQPLLMDLLQHGSHTA